MKSRNAASKTSLAITSLVVLALVHFPSCAAQTTASSHPIAGEWQGTLSAGGAQLPLVLHITEAQDDALKATFDSPDQHANGIPVTTIHLQDSTLTFAIAAIHGSFTGTLAKDGNEIDGAWTQGQTFPLNFKRTTGAVQPTVERPRPQNPAKPYPYVSQDVTYANADQHNTLAATLTVPPGKGPFPAVLLIAGSGPNDRDETIFGHKPFLVLSDFLTRRGIVVLRADKRGIGQSTGNLATATTADFATDAEAGVAFLKTRPEVDPHRIGLIGHSEGAVIAPMVAARDRDIAFIVMMAGDGVPGVEIIPEQVLLLGEAAGVPPVTAEKNAATERVLLDLVVSEKDPAVLDKELRAKLTGLVPETRIAADIKTLTSPWFRYFLTYDPAPALRQVRCPVLVLSGSKDLQVAPAQNLPAIRVALTAGGNQHFEIDEIPGLNHLFQTAQTGSPSEYAAIDETLSPLVLEKIASWILQQR